VRLSSCRFRTSGVLGDGGAMCTLYIVDMFGSRLVLRLVAYLCGMGGALPVAHNL